MSPTIRSPKLVTLLSAVLCLHAPLGAVRPADGEVAPAMKDPTFTKESSAETFQKGKALFAEEKYGEAEVQFKKVKTDAKGKEDKAIVDKWVAATSGATLLGKLKKSPQTNRLALYDQLVLQHYPKYRDTPAGPIFREYIDELDKALFQVIEDFNSPTAAYSEKFGKFFINDPKQSFDGSFCLRWASTKDRKASALKIQGTDVPTDWSAFTSIEFWVSTKVAPRGTAAVIMCGGPGAAKPAPGKAGAGKAGEGKAVATENFYQASLDDIASAPGKWKRVRVPFTEFRSNGAASMGSVAYFQFQIPGGSQFDFLIDRVALVRGGSPGAGAAPAKR